MNIGERITALRKKNGWSQYELAKRLEISREIIGRYERNDAAPSIEIAKKIADIFEVSLDYLAGMAEEEVDKTTLNRLLEINKLSQKDQDTVYNLIDAFITKSKLQDIM